MAPEIEERIEVKHAEHVYKDHEAKSKAELHDIEA